MEDVIIHIGYNKSASTFLQKKIPHLPVNYLLLVGPERKYLDMIVSKTALDVSAIHRWINLEIKQKYGDNIHNRLLLSHEDLAGLLTSNTPEMAYATAQNLKQIFPNAKILIIIRNQIDYLLSLYAFRVAVKGAETHNLNHFIKEISKRGVFTQLQYHLLIKRYQDLFGASSVLVLPMEMLKKAPEEMFEKIFSFIGAPSQPIQTSDMVNVSTKNLAVLFIFRCLNWIFNLFHSLVMFFTPRNFKAKVSFNIRYYYNRFKRNSAPILNRLFYSSSSLDSKSLLIEEEILSLIKESNMWIKRNLSIDLGSLGYPIYDTN